MNTALQPLYRLGASLAVDWCCTSFELRGVEECPHLAERHTDVQA